MKKNNVKQGLITLCLLVTVCITSCRTSNAPTNANASSTESRNSPPQRVDIKGSIITKHYSQGQVIIEVEGLISQNTRYNRAFVLVLPTTQIVGITGSSISLSELQQGQNVAVLLRAGGKGNLVGMGVARKMWVE